MATTGRILLQRPGGAWLAEVLNFAEAAYLTAAQAFADSAVPDDGDLSRPAQVFVPEADNDRAHQLFYAEREDEL